MDIEQRDLQNSPIYDSSSEQWRGITELSELFRYRFLLSNLIRRDLKVRYKRSPIGFAWVVLNPLLMMTVLTIVFSQIFRFGIPHFPVYLLAGILMFNLFSQGTNAAMAQLQGSGALLQRMYVPPSVFVVAAVGSAIVNLLFSLIPFLSIAFINGVRPTWGWLLIVVPIIITAVFTVGIGLIVGASVIFFTDTFEIYQVFLNVFYFLTPIFYPVSALHPPVSLFENFNPMFLFIDALRSAIFTGQLTVLPNMLVATAYALSAIIIGWTLFTRTEDTFAYHF